MAGNSSLLLAFAAGIVSFVSSCCLPLVPGYLATVSGATPTDLAGRRIDGRVLARSLVFVATLSAMFVLLGLGATALGSFLSAHTPLLNQIAGISIPCHGRPVRGIGVPGAAEPRVATTRAE